MLVGAKLGKDKAGVVEKPDPVSKEEFAVVKILVCPTCTEYHGHHADGENDCLGHEAAGEVVEVAQPGAVEVGDRVVVMPQYPCGKCALCLSGEYIHCTRGRDVSGLYDGAPATATYAQYTVKQDWLLIPIPDGMSIEHASMACCGLGPTFNAMKLMTVGPFDTVLITGMGPVGLGGVINARFRGARVIAVESQPYRAALAKELGAEAVINPEDEDAVQQVMDLTGGLGVDKSVDTSGSAAAASRGDERPARRESLPSANSTRPPQPPGAAGAKPFLINAARRKSHVSFVGWGGEVDCGAIIAKGLTLHGVWHYNMADAPAMMQMIAAVGDQLDKLITHTFPLSDIQKAWELQCSGNCGKVLLYPWK